MKIGGIRHEIGSFRTLFPNAEPFEFLGLKKFADYYLMAELQTKRWINRKLPRDGVFIDVGSNVGILSACAAIKATEGQVISIEPTDTFQLLVNNLKNLPKLSAKLDLINCAVGSTSGAKKEKIYKIWGDEPVEEVFNFRTLDEIVDELKPLRVDVIKIDTDGFELEVLKGAVKTIGKFQPTMIVEINEALATRGTTQQEIFEFMIEQKYDSALIMDGANFIFESNWKIGMVWPNSISVATDREQINFSSRGKLLLESKSPEVVFLERRVTFTNHPSYLLFHGQIETWAFATAFSLESESVFPSSVIICISGENIYGEIGFAALNQDGSHFLSEEKSVSKPGKFEIFLQSTDFEQRIVMRPISHAPFKFRIQKISLFEVGSTENLGDANIPEITILNADELFKVMGLIGEESNAPKLFKSDDGYLMEQSSAHFLKSLYRCYRPKRHLEVGTWEGFGAELALSNGAEEVWSIEKHEGINPEYGSRYRDTGENYSAGWLVSDKNRSKYHQLFGTSQTIIIDDSFHGFFDSILIDGAHDKSSVLQDTEFALKLSKKGTLVIWDDYPLRVADKNTTRDGVLEAIIADLPQLKENFELYAIEGTSLLLGIKK